MWIRLTNPVITTQNNNLILEGKENLVEYQTKSYCLSTCSIIQADKGMSSCHLIISDLFLFSSTKYYHSYHYKQALLIFRYI